MKNKQKIFITEHVYYVRANDNRTDTAIIAKDEDDVVAKLEQNRYWQQNKLRPILIRKLAQS